MSYIAHKEVTCYPHSPLSSLVLPSSTPFSLCQDYADLMHDPQSSSPIGGKFHIIFPSCKVIRSHSAFGPRHKPWRFWIRPREQNPSHVLFTAVYSSMCNTYMYIVRNLPWICMQYCSVINIFVCDPVKLMCYFAFSVSTNCYVQVLLYYSIYNSYMLHVICHINL